VIKMVKKSLGGFPPVIKPHSDTYEGIIVPWSIVLYNLKPEDAVRYLVARGKKIKDVDKPEFTLTKEINRQAIIEDLMKEYNFIAPINNRIDKECKNGDIELFCYANGVYRPTGTHVIKNYGYSKVKAIIEKKDFDVILDYIKVHKLYPRENLNTEKRLTMKDCNYNWVTKKVEPHSPDVHNTISIPVTWDNPNANVKPFQDFLEKVMLPNEIQAMYELIGYCLYYGNMAIRELFIFYGSQTACGKSVCANVITKILGVENTNSATLSELVKKRFAGSMMVGKMVNVCPEEPPGTLPTGRIKAWTGQDRTNSERKGRDEETDYTTAKMIVLSNHLPDFETSEESIFTRINVFSFPNSFKDEMDNELTDKLTTPNVLSGILQKSIDAFNKLEIRGKFSNWKPIDTRERMVHTVSNSLRAFAEIFVVRGEFDDKLTKHEFHMVYSNSFCTTIGTEAKVMTKIQCGKALPKILDYVEDGKQDKYVGEDKFNQERVWRYIKWKEPGIIKDNMNELMGSMGKKLPENWEPLIIKTEEAEPPKREPKYKNITDDYDSADDYAGRYPYD